MRLLRLSLLLVLPLTAGCYKYVPSSVGEVEPGESVRARLTPDAARLFEDALFPDARGARLLEGEILAKSDTSLLMLVPSVQRTQGIRMQTFGQRAEIPISGVTEVELRQIDGLATGLLVGGGVLAAGIGVALGLSGNEGETDRPRDGPGPDEIRIPFSLPLSLFLGR